MTEVYFGRRRISEGKQGTEGNQNLVPMRFTQISAPLGKEKHELGDSDHCRRAGLCCILSIQSEHYLKIVQGREMLNLLWSSGERNVEWTAEGWELQTGTQIIGLPGL